MEWDYYGKPAIAGWYAVLVCYDEHEGVFPMDAWWDGSKWQEKSVIAFGDSMQTKKEAEDLAYEHDPDELL